MGMRGVDVIGTFNNESREDVAEIKKAASEFIDMINKHGVDGRRNSIAVTHVEQATMMAVKSIFS